MNEGFGVESKDELDIIRALNRDGVRVDNAFKSKISETYERPEEEGVSKEAKEELAHIRALNRDGVYVDNAFESKIPETYERPEEEGLSKEAKEELAHIRALNRDGVYLGNDPEIHERFLQRCEKKYKDFATKIIEEIPTSYSDNRTDEVKINNTIQVNQEVINESYDILLKCNIPSKTINEEYIMQIFNNLENLSTQPELYTKLVKKIFENLHKFRQELYNSNCKRGYCLINSYLPSQEMLIGSRELVTYLIILSIIIEKGYNLDLDQLSNITLFMEENHYLKVPLYFAIAGLQNAIIKNTNYVTAHFDYSIIENPINFVSKYEGKKEITLKELTCFMIKALCTKHKISDDELNYPKKRDNLANFKAERKKQMEIDKNYTNVQEERKVK